MVRFSIALGLSVLFLFGIVAYTVHIHGSALALTASAANIRSTGDAVEEIANWRKREGQLFWRESDQPGGDHNYDAQIENLSLSRFRIVEPTEVTLGITMRGGELRSVTLVMTTGRKPSVSSSVWVQEWFDAGGPALIHVNEKGKPWKATVDLTSAVPDSQRRKALALNTKCLVRMGGCRSAEEILPGVWQLARLDGTSGSDDRPSL